MDIATVVGLLGAFAMVLLGILNGGSLDKFVDATSIFIVVGGGLMVMMMRSTLADFLKLGGIIGKAFGAKVDDPVDLINQLVELGTLARKDGMIALEGQEIGNQFLAKGIGMLVDGGVWRILHFLPSIDTFSTRVIFRFIHRRSTLSRQPGIPRPLATIEPMLTGMSMKYLSFIDRGISVFGKILR